VQSPQSDAQAEIAAGGAFFKEYAETMRQLKERLDEPFVTVNTITGDTGIKQAQDEYDQLMRNKTPKSRRK
jgi:soluble P-type ATPase